MFFVPTDDMAYHDMTRIEENLYIGKYDEYTWKNCKQFYKYLETHPGTLGMAGEALGLGFDWFLYKIYDAVVAYDEKCDRFIGNCLVDSDLHWVEEMYVEKEYRSLGIGGKLLEIGISRFGAKFVAPKKDNIRAIKFYNAHGFETYSEEDLCRDDNYPRPHTKIIQMIRQGAL